MDTTFARYDLIGRGLDHALLIGLGVATIIVGIYRIRRKVSSGEYDEAKGKSQSKRTWIFGCLLIALGLFQFIFASRASNQEYSWRRIVTTDGYASAEFPVSPTKEEKTYQDGTSSIHMITFNCNPHNMNLRLTYSQIPEKYANLTNSERLEAMKAGLRRAGFTITTFTNENIGAIPVYRIVADENNGNAESILRIALQHNAIYRIIASFPHGLKNDPTITEFINSFQIH